MTQQTFLVEIGTEELPPKALRSWRRPLPTTSAQSWIMPVWRTAISNGSPHRAAWR
ncbi:hypothetical protein O0544_07730 [Edwardsiella anguillarum]|nr:hypothetical protein [Edwardsiella anguillarum]